MLFAGIETPVWRIGVNPKLGVLDILSVCSLYLQRLFVDVLRFFTALNLNRRVFLMDNKENGRSLASLKELPAGHRFPSISYDLTESLITKYLDAVGEQREFLEERVVPPLAIAACAMTALSESFSVPPGSIHAAQDLEFCRSVPLDERVSCSGKIASRLERGRLNLISIEINAVDQKGNIVLTGKATIAVPD